MVTYADIVLIRLALITLTLGVILIAILES